VARWPRFRSIRSKLVGIIGLVTASALILGFGIVILNDASAFKRDTLQQTVLTAHVIREYSASDLVFYDQEAAGTTLSKLAALPDITYACLYDATGKLFAAFGTTDGSETPLLGPVTSVRFAPSFLHVSVPVSVDGELYGILYIKASTANLKKKTLQHIVTLVVLLAILLVLAVAAGYYLQRIISGPILELAATTHRISTTGDHSIRVKRLGDDEIAVLCNGFNDMLDQINLRQLERDAAELRTREKSQFLAAMSHELRTPLNSIIGFSEILLTRAGERLDARHRRFLEIIHTSGQHLLGIINDILDLSKVEAGRMELAPEPVSLRAIIEGVITVMRGASEKQQVQIQAEIPLDLPLIEADPVKLKQIFFNLLSNAVKFSSARSIVRVYASELALAQSPLGKDTVEVAVVDRGIGVAEEDREKIFSPFRQADSGVTRRFGGTGLGLSLVKNFVQLHGGKVLLESEPGKGSTFTVLLPIRLTVVCEGDWETAPAPRSSRYVIIVDPDESRGSALRQQLANAGFGSLDARDADQAMSVSRSTTPLAYLFNMAVTPSDSWRTIRDIKLNRKASRIPIVLHAADANRGLGFSLEVDDMFVKPLGTEKLAARIEEMVPPAARESTPVIVVDDDLSVHDELERRLVPGGFRLHKLISSSDDFSSLRPPDPSLVVIDPLTAKGEGLEAAINLRSQPALAHIPLLFHTSAEVGPEHGATLAQAFFYEDREPRSRSVLTALRHLVARVG
jgi:signal transduction histidine kinase/DNA-binding response OmpR family regulator